MGSKYQISICTRTVAVNFKHVAGKALIVVEEVRAKLALRLVFSVEAFNKEIFE